MLKEYLNNILERLEKEKSFYIRYLKKRDRKRKRERDTFFTERDRNIFIESFVIGGLLEKVILKAVERIF